jgi:hypothetical protein
VEEGELLQALGQAQEEEEAGGWCGQDDHPVGNPKRKVWWAQ